MIIGDHDLWYSTQPDCSREVNDEMGKGAVWLLAKENCVITPQLLDTLSAPQAAAVALSGLSWPFSAIPWSFFCIPSTAS